MMRVQQTHGQIAPLRAVLEDPKTPVFDEIGPLIPRGVARPEAFFCGQTRFLRAERNDILLFSGCKQAGTSRRTIKHIPRESTWHS